MSMYIRWITRKHKSDLATHVTFHDAYLVESYRDDGGMPKQHTVAYLGNIRQIGDDLPNIERELFLARARNTLDQLPDVPPAEREEVMAQLHRKVPPLTYHEVLLAFQQNLRWVYQWCNVNKMPPPTPKDVGQMMEMIR
jgi:hypothetical protein